MTTLFQRHYSDESLISHLDGELPFYRRSLVRRHLEKCWQCRLRLSEIETQVLDATRAMEQDVFPGPQRIAEARLQFLNRADAIANEVLQAKARPRRAAAVRGLAWAAACLMLIGAFSVWRLTRPEPPLAAVEVAKRVESAAAAAARVPSRQRFKVVTRQLRPAAASRESRLEIWSEPDRGQFTTRFSDSAGVLRHAVWQPEPGRQYVYNAAGAAEVVRISRRQAIEAWDGILFRDGLTLEGMESGLLTWLENRPWRPVSFSSGIALLATGDGASMSVEELPAGLRLSARKSVGNVAVEFILEVDRRTYTPRLQSIRYESPARALELQLTTEPAVMAAAVTFEPPGSLVKFQAAAPLAPPPLIPSVSPASPEMDADSFEVEIYHALHRARACLGETIEIERATDGTFLVRGAVVSPERKDEIAVSLAHLSGPRLALDIKSVSEMLREIGPVSTAPAQQPAGNRSADRERAIKSLSRFFNGNANETEEFAERVLSAGEEFMKDAQALRQLAERFSGRPGLESRHVRRLLESMSYDHLKDLEAKIQATRVLLTPVLGGFAPRPPATPAARGRWNSDLLLIFSQAGSLNERLRNLFAGGVARGQEDRLIRELGDAIAPLQTSIQTASAR